MSEREGAVLGPKIRSCSKTGFWSDAMAKPSTKVTFVEDVVGPTEDVVEVAGNLSEAVSG